MIATGPAAKRPPHMPLSGCGLPSVSVICLSLEGCESRLSMLYTVLLLGVTGAHPGPVAWEAARAGGLTKLAPVEAPVPVPDTAFVDADGAQVQLADFRGRVVLVNFWATWCAPCREEMPSLDALE